VSVQDPAPAAITPAPKPTTPVTTRPGTATIPQVTVTGSPFTDPRILTHHGRRTLTFRITRTARVTVTLERRTGSGFHAAGTRTLKLVPGLQSLPITTRLLGMRVPRGAFRVTLSSGTSPTATVAFTRR
jgi:hypothetical protein